jgi:hypothetical protein
MTLVKKFKSPAKAVLNSSPFDETILILMNNLYSNSLQPVGKQL